MKFNIIYADPPWVYADQANAGKRGAIHKYDLMTIDELKQLPISKISADDCALFLWTTMPQLDVALELIKAWGFKYKTNAFTWIKKTKNDKLFWGMGRWTRSNAEVCLLATKGKPKRLSAGVHSVISSVIEKHSKKPDETYDRIEKLVGPLPRIELFARQYRVGWKAWGNELDKANESYFDLDLLNGIDNLKLN